MLRSTGKLMMSMPAVREWLDADVEYVDNWSFWLDLQIIGRTFVEVFRRRGITPRDMEVMPPFQGESSDV